MSVKNVAAVPAAPSQLPVKKVVRIIFLALVCDLLAFTMPLPLFPRLINDFVHKEALIGSATPTLLSRTLTFVRSVRLFLFSYSGLQPLSQVADERWDLTLLGGLLASLFSFCQFIISPHLGSLSDKYGRRPVLLFSMLGNIASALLWLFASGFGTYAASRIVGGLSEGNVQLSIACISDVTSPSTRSKSLALVGVAFSVAFTLGPSLGAYFASRTVGKGSSVTLLGQHINLNVYAVPAAVTLILLIVETTYLWKALPETRWYKEGKEEEVEGEVTEVKPVPRTYTERLLRLKELQWLHLGFLFFFSGAEFTLTFLTYNLFNYTNAQNGKLLGFIGVLSSLLQGGYVRRRRSTLNGPAHLARSGIFTCAFSLVLLTILPHVGSMGGYTSLPSLILYTASAGLAFVSATVVNSLNAMASLECSAVDLPGEDGKEIEKGLALGTFRSRGQLGRAVGPLLATVVYWCFGPSYAYGTAALGATAMAFKMSRLVSGKSTGVRKGLEKAKKGASKPVAAATPKKNGVSKEKKEL